MVRISKSKPWMPPEIKDRAEKWKEDFIRLGQKAKRENDVRAVLKLEDRAREIGNYEEADMLHASIEKTVRYQEIKYFRRFDWKARSFRWNITGWITDPLTRKRMFVTRGWFAPYLRRFEFR